MSSRVIVLNGASSSGKTTLARALQAVLPGRWLRFSIDDLVAALPEKLLGTGGIAFGEEGQVSVGEAFRELERAWMTGLAATARAGANLIVDDVFLGGAASQRRWQEALGDLPVCWVGVYCDLAVAQNRERQRPDRAAGMHAQQASLVHQDVIYSLTVDSSATDALQLAHEMSKQL